VHSKTKNLIYSQKENRLAGGHQGSFLLTKSPQSNPAPMDGLRTCPPPWRTPWVTLDRCLGQLVTIRPSCLFRKTLAAATTDSVIAFYVDAANAMLSMAKIPYTCAEMHCSPHASSRISFHAIMLNNAVGTQWPVRTQRQQPYHETVLFTPHYMQDIGITSVHYHEAVRSEEALLIMCMQKQQQSVLRPFSLNARQCRQDPLTPPSRCWCCMP
jgi:hypothetical protein